MREIITPEKIFNDVNNNTMKETVATQFLIALIEGNDNINVRAKCIEIFEKLRFFNKEIFKVLEDCLLSDESPKVRASAARVIVNNYLEEGIAPLRWVIQHENSSLVLKTLKNMLKNVDEKNIHVLKEEFSERLEKIASKYGIYPEEAVFILDLGVDIDYSKDTKLFTEYDIIYGSNAICAVKKGHVSALSFSLKKKIPKSIGLLSRLESLNLSCNKLIALPSSINSLSMLKNLDLSWNNFVSFPEVLRQLSPIKELKLRLDYNEVKEIPEWVNKLECLKYLDLRHNQIKIIPDSIGSLKSLEYLDLRDNYIQKIPESIGSLSSLKVISLNGNLIEEIPKSIGKLASLKVLYLNNNKIQEIPDSIGNLNSLEDLDLGNNNIKKIPESLGNLNGLISLNLKNNEITEIPESIRMLKRLKLLYF